MFREILKSLILDKSTRKEIVIVMIIDTMFFIAGICSMFNPITRWMGVCFILLSFSPALLLLTIKLSIPKTLQENNSVEKGNSHT